MNLRALLLSAFVPLACEGEAASPAEGTTGDVAATTESTDAETSTSSSGSSSGSTSADFEDETGDTSGGDETGDEVVESRCEVSAVTVVCSHHSETLLTGLSGLAPREVHWQVPLGVPPAQGWPVAILFQGSLFTAETFWAVLQADPLGMRYQGMLTKTLLDRGFAVITPEAHLGGFTAWETNVPPMSEVWEASADHHFMLDLFDAIEQQDFGPLDTSRMYAGGISSGGYMTSRMDLAYRERFRAVAIQSASWATCVGPVCQVPDLDAEHLPTLFLHGDADDIVPVETMIPYRDGLDALGVETKTLIDPGAQHAWLPEAPEEITAWFEGH